MPSSRAHSFSLSKKARGIAAAPGAGMARTTAPCATSLPNRPKPPPRNASVASAMTSGLRRSGLSVPYFSRLSSKPMRGNGGGVTVRPSAELLEQPGQHRLDRREDVVLGDERHLEVELVELAGRAVGARVLVAEARRDLEVAVEAGRHQQLLELLRRLRQRVELAGVIAARHQIVARALRRRGGQDRRLKLQEAGVDHPLPQRGDEAAAQHDVAMQPLAPQIEEAVAQAEVLAVVGVDGDLHRQHLGRRFDGEDLDAHLDFAGRQRRVDGLRRPRAPPCR